MVAQTRLGPQTITLTKATRSFCQSCLCMRITIHVLRPGYLEGTLLNSVRWITFIFLGGSFYYPPLHVRVLEVLGRDKTSPRLWDTDRCAWAYTCHTPCLSHFCFSRVQVKHVCIIFACRSYSQQEEGDVGLCVWRQTAS